MAAVKPDYVAHELAPGVLPMLKRIGRLDISVLPWWLGRGLMEAGAWLGSRDPALASVAIRDVVAAGEGGDIRLRVYAPPPAAEPGNTCVLFAHGGGFVLGSLATHDALCRDLCLMLGAPVIAVDYRRAPECLAPAMHRDVLAGYTWAHAHAHELRPAADAGPLRVLLAGDSAGATISAALCHHFALSALGRPSSLGPPVEASLSPPAGALLLYPGADLTATPATHPSLGRYSGQGWVLTAALRRCFQDAYLGLGGLAAAQASRDPILSPGLAPRDLLARFPPVVVVTASHDMLHDEGAAFARALRAAGAPVAHVEGTGLWHGFAQQLQDVPAGKAVLRDAIAHLRRLWAEPAAPAGGLSSGGRGGTAAVTAESRH